MNVKLPSNGIEDASINRQYLVGGLTFQPHKGVSIKLDYYNRITGDVNPILVATPFPASQPFYRSQHFINLGVGYSF